MRVLVIENYPNTPLGLVGAALDEGGAEVSVLRMHAGDPLPESDSSYDALVMLGGAQSAVDDADHPYLAAEAALARRFGDGDKPVLGICLGAQLLARAYGGTNILGRPPEFGWHPVRPTSAGARDPVLAAIGDAAPVFHWHTDTFTLPAGAVHLATSAITEQQAFRIGRAAYGIQFHFEAGTELVAAWTAELAEEIDRVRPDWRVRHAEEAARHGAAADRVGLAIARAWARLIRPAGSSVPANSAKAPAAPLA